MKVIVGLGNPGKKYFQTRHNIGRQLIEDLAADFKAVFSVKKNLKASVALVKHADQECFLVYPEVFMNLSGETLGLLVRALKFNPQTDLLVVVDDVALPLGRLRLRCKGSSGGHNGLRSVEAGLATQEYARLRIGIESREAQQAEASETALERFVLERFRAAEQKVLGPVLVKAAEACRIWLERGCEPAMNAVNCYESEG